MNWITLSEARHGSFCAIDFEIADYARDSACALAITRVERNRITDEWSTLIRPPGGHVHPRFTQIHGITSSDVATAPDFEEAWATARRKLRGARFIAAHNAGFDASVLQAAAARYGTSLPRIPFLCTVQLARHRWNLRPTRLPDVAAALGLPLDHHDHESDARACAGIVTAWRRRVPLQSAPERNEHQSQPTQAGGA